MDVRILAGVIPLAPFILVGTPFVLGAFTHSYSPILYVAIAAFLMGLLGIAGIVLASMENTYRKPGRARLAVRFLMCGVISAVTAGVIYGANTQNQLITIFVGANLLCPVIVGVDSIRRLRDSMARHSEGQVV
ncbi:hypothetical protein [Microbulbifer zhoushanensis]|uniref:hypothetical protein n=1 Tax=Microbulbifer TaxID=48073 RepID=UPI001F2F8B13|nr:hypothetical protein [Microbulbifer zhoushanensis]